MRSEDLDERDFESWNFTVHENTSQIKLDLETDIDIGAVDCGWPPKSETTIWDLIKTRTLRMCQLLVLHRLFETWSFLPEKTFPGWEVSALE